jgi:hypothetical protein
MLCTGPFWPCGIGSALPPLEKGRVGVGIQGRSPPGSLRSPTSRFQGEVALRHANAITLPLQGRVQCERLSGSYARKSAQSFCHLANMKSLFHWPVPALLLAMTMAGCASAPQLAQSNNERCAASGHAPGTDAFANCVVRLETESQVRRDARHREMVERSAIPQIR